LKILPVFLITFLEEDFQLPHFRTPPLSSVFRDFRDYSSPSSVFDFARTALSFLFQPPVFPFHTSFSLSSRGSSRLQFPDRCSSLSLCQCSDAEYIFFFLFPCVFFLIAHCASPFFLDLILLAFFGSESVFAPASSFPPVLPFFCKG